MAKIAKVWARQILDSRGNPSLEVDVTLFRVVLPLVNAKLANSAMATRRPISARALSLP